MGDGKICFFSGHSDASESVYPALAEAVERHTTGYGVAEFRMGNYGGFDRMAARAVLISPVRRKRTIKQRPMLYEE